MATSRWAKEGRGGRRGDGAVSVLAMWVHGGGAVLVTGYTVAALQVCCAAGGQGHAHVCMHTFHTRAHSCVHVAHGTHATHPYNGHVARGTHATHKPTN